MFFQRAKHFNKNYCQSEFYLVGSKFKQMNKKISKVALIFFPLNDVGGLLTWNKEIIKGFNRLGVSTMYFYLTPGNKYTVDPEIETMDCKSLKLPGWHLSYGGKHLKETLAVLNQFDVVLFTKVSPHPTKANLAAKDIQNWLILYQEITVPKIVVFHDALWQKTNSWCDLAAPYIDLCVAAQKKFMQSVVEYPAECNKYWDYFPMDFKVIDKLDLNHKEKFGMLATQWIGWKNHKKFIPQLSAVKVPMKLYGLGIEWYYLRKTAAYQAAINMDFANPHVKGNTEAGVQYNPRAIHNMYGLQYYHDLQKIYAKALFSIDLSTRGYTNYTHFEPLAYKTVSMIERNVVQDPDNVIPEDCCLPYDLDTAYKTINKFATEYDPKIINKILANGQKFIRSSDCIEVAKRLLGNIKKI